jgi:ribonuclease P protein component
MVLNKLKSNDFKCLRENGKTFKTPNFLFVYRIKEESETKNTLNVGFTITKKVGNACLRNKIRRRLRESVRTLPNLLELHPLSFDDLNLNIVVLQKKPETLVYSNVHEQIQHFFKNRVLS